MFVLLPLATAVVNVDRLIVVCSVSIAAVRF